jgi:hypothetical protein
MKIFFNTSVSGRKEYEENYKAIDRILNRISNNVVSAVFIATKEDVAKETEKEAASYYDKLRKWMRDSDILVFEVSYPSLGVGYEITWGLQLGKPIIILYVRGKKPHVLDAIPDDKIQVYEYDLSDLEKILKSAVDYASEQMDTRFNFFISPKIANYLDWVARKKRTPRAVYLRRLIEKDMKESKLEI